MLIFLPSLPPPMIQTWIFGGIKSFIAHPGASFSNLSLSLPVVVETPFSFLTSGVIHFLSRFLLFLGFCFNPRHFFFLLTSLHIFNFQCLLSLAMETDESCRVLPFQLQYDKPLASQVFYIPRSNLCYC
jgi:hypothetical protein